MINVTEESNTHHFHPHVFSTIVMAITFLVGVPGNMIVIWITSWKMKRTVNTIWFWNLAVADLTCCLFIPLSIVPLFHHDWLYGPAMCKIVPMIVHLTMYASVFTLVAISIDRCLLVVQPVWAQNKRSLQMAWILCLVIWMLSFLMCLPSILHRKAILYANVTYCMYIYEDYDYEYDYDATDHSSSDNSTFEHDGPHPVYVTITYTRMIFGFLIPLLIVSSCYILLASKVQSTRLFKVGKKTTKVVLSIVVAFFVTWAPFHIIGVILLYLNTPLLQSLDSLSMALAYFNSCINPVLYVFMGKDMKKKVRQSVRGLMQNAFSEEISRSTERTRSKLTTEDSMAI